MNENAIAKVPQALAAYDPAKYNLVMPMIAAQDIPRGARQSVRVVKIDIGAKSGDVFSPSRDKYALSSQALNRIANAAGISVLDTVRTDDRRRAHVYGYATKLRVMDPDGLVRERMMTHEVDYSDGGKDFEKILAEAEKANDGKGRDPGPEIIEKRKNAPQFCATSSMLRAIRKILDLKSTYTAEELAKEFVIPRLIPDTADDDVKRAVVGTMTGAIEHMYPEPRTIEAPQAPVEIEAPKPPEKPPQDPAIKAKLRTAWQMAKGAGCTTEKFAALCKKETGKASSDDLTMDDVAKIEASVSAEIDKIAAEESIPF